MLLLNVNNNGRYADCTEKAWCVMCDKLLRASTPCLTDSILITMVNAFAKLVYPNLEHPLVFDRDTFNEHARRYNALDFICWLDSHFSPDCKFFCYSPSACVYCSASDWRDLDALTGDLTLEAMRDNVRTLWHPERTDEFELFYEQTKDLQQIMIAYAREVFHLRGVSDDAGVLSHADRYGFKD